VFELQVLYSEMTSEKMSREMSRGTRDILAKIEMSRETFRKVENVSHMRDILKILENVSRDIFGTKCLANFESMSRETFGKINNVSRMSRICETFVRHLCLARHFLFQSESDASTRLCDMAAAVRL
jgi:hypothetical protein